MLQLCPVQNTLASKFATSSEAPLFRCQNVFLHQSRLRRDWWSEERGERRKVRTAETPTFDPLALAGAPEMLWEMVKQRLWQWLADFAS